MKRLSLMLLVSLVANSVFAADTNTNSNVASKVVAPVKAEASFEQLLANLKAKSSKCLYTAEEFFALFNAANELQAWVNKADEATIVAIYSQLHTVIHGKTKHFGVYSNLNAEQKKLVKGNFNTHLETIKQDALEGLKQCSKFSIFNAKYPNAITNAKTAAKVAGLAAATYLAYRKVQKAGGLKEVAKSAVAFAKDNKVTNFVADKGSQAGSYLASTKAADMFNSGWNYVASKLPTNAAAIKGLQALSETLSK